ncbi:MAG: hypothetical protein HUU49_00360 [Candidatus Buchananbacteria bacterium]|nr:hypothetical protein [Candidatus Buchananbacteria bacterium]
MTAEYKPIQFPEDESSHDFIVEWWYFNGHLTDHSGKEYSFMNCLFKVDVKKVKIPFLSKVPLKISYFSHSLVTDLAARYFYHRITPFSIVSKLSFTKPLLYVEYVNPEIKKSYDNCLIEKTGESTYRVKNEDLDLLLTSVKAPLLEGGTGFLDLQSKTTYYYSLTNLKTKGRIKINDVWIDVTGKSWMDHQWANTQYTKDRWDWFSIQLDNDTEIVCYMYDAGKVKNYLADISYPDGRQEHYEKIKIIPGDRVWTSPKSKAVYPLDWTIEIPKAKINLALQAKIDNQEMLFGSINYWEGPLRVSGECAGQKVTGLGFMELVGYPSEYNNVKYIKDEVNKTLNKLASLAKSKAADLTTYLKNDFFDQ